MVKKNKKQDSYWDEDFEEDAPVATPEQSAEAEASMEDSDLMKLAKKSAKKNEKDEADQDEEAGEVQIKSKKQKEKERKQRQKELEKKKKQPPKKGSNNKQNENAELESPKAEEEEPLKQESAPKGKGKKKGPNVAALKALLAEKKAAEEEARLKEEEEKRLIEEQKRKEEEEERLKEEARLKKKEKEKARKERLRKEGKLLTKTQKEQQKRNELKLKALLDQGVIIPAFDEKKDSSLEKPKKFTYGNKRNRGKNQQKKTVEEAPEVVEEVKNFETAVENDVLESWEDVAEEIENVKESWDQESEEEGPSVKEAWDEDSESSAKENKQSKGENESDTSSESGSSDSDDSSDEEELSATQKAALKKKQESAERRKQRHEDAMAARSADNLRSPICCILGHVDTGKTKLLDNIRRTNVQEGEAGGITQQIGATYFPMENIITKTQLLNKDGKIEYKLPGLLIIDTPGHESFTNLRSRGSSLCNIAILVVDIMHGLEPQTLESLRLLRDKKTPFIVALNKIDRLYEWEATTDHPSIYSLAKQKEHVSREFRNRTEKIIVEFAEQGLNAALYFENKNKNKIISLVPTSAITGEGIPDLLMLLVNLTQTRMSDKLMYLSELECTVLEVKVTEGLGTTIDVVLSNGVLHEGDKIVVCGLNGPIITSIRALLTPQPLKELRVKSAYVHHKEVKAAMGVKIAANDLDKAIAGSRLLVLGPDDDEEDLKDEVMSDLQNLLSSVDKSGKGVYVQASTLGSLEALLEFLRTSKIPVSGINIGPVHKKDVMRCSVMLEQAREFAVILAFDVKIDKDAELLAEELHVRLFKADIIYHLFDQFTAYHEGMLEQKRKDQAPQAVFPCLLKIIPGCVFNKRDPIILGVDVVEGSLRVGTPICTVITEGEEKNVVTLGKVSSIEQNHKSLDMVKKGQAGGGVAIRIDCATYETPKLFGRHFFENSELVSKVSRGSIDILKESFRNDVSKEEWALIIKLKKMLNIQ